MQQLVEGNYEKRVMRLCDEAREEGRKEGWEEGREESLVRARKLLRRLTAAQFDAETAEQLAVLLDHINNPSRLEDVGDWIANGYTKAEFLRRVEGLIT